MMIFENSEDFFSKDKGSFRRIAIEKRMEVAMRIKSAIGKEVVDLRMPSKKITKSLNGDDEAEFK